MQNPPVTQPTKVPETDPTSGAVNYQPGTVGPTGGPDNPGPADPALAGVDLTAGFRPSVITSEPAQKKTQENIDNLNAMTQKQPATTTTTGGVTMYLQADGTYSLKPPASGTNASTGNGFKPDNSGNINKEQGSTQNPQFDTTGLDADLKANTDSLDALRARMSAASQALIDSIKQKYEQRKAAMADVNTRSLAGLTQIGLKSGRARYAPEVETGILSSEERAGISRLASLDAEESSLIAQAQMAHEENDFKLLNQRMQMISDVRKEKNQLLQQQFENTMKINEQVMQESQRKLQEQQTTFNILDKFVDSGIDFNNVPEATRSILDDKFGSGFTKSYMEAKKTSGEKPIEVDGVLVQKQSDGTYKAVYSSPSAGKAAYGPGIIGEYQYYVQQEKDAGRTPVSFNEYQTMDANRKAKAEQQTIGPSGLTPQQFSVFNALQDNARQDKDIALFTDVRDGYAMGRSAAQDPNHGVGDLLLLRSLAKVTDPTTGIREEEYKSFQAAQGALDRIGVTLTEKMWNGTQLTEEARKAFMSQLQKKYDEKKRAYESSAERVRKAGERFGLPNDVVEQIVPSYTAQTSTGSKGASTQSLEREFKKLFPNDNFQKALNEKGSDVIQQFLESQGVSFNNDLSMSGNGSSAGKIVAVTIGSRPVRVDASISDKLASADADFFAATGKHIQVNQDVRTSAQQKALYDKYKSGKGGRAAPPGKSFHEKGLAVDVTNWKEAMPYLQKYGFKNPLADDKGHFSVGEFG